MQHASRKKSLQHFSIPASFHASGIRFIITVSLSYSYVITIIMVMILGRWIIKWQWHFTLPETNSLPLKMDSWNTTFLLGSPIFRGYVSFREGSHPSTSRLQAPFQRLPQGVHTRRTGFLRTIHKNPRCLVTKVFLSETIKKNLRVVQAAYLIPSVNHKSSNPWVCGWVIHAPFYPTPTLESFREFFLVHPCFTGRLASPPANDCDFPRTFGHLGDTFRGFDLIGSNSYVQKTWWLKSWLDSWK